ncbi:MAG TPA: peptidase S10 [Terracidiphilus sp.]|jgi:carboxypeptidase C (cathepsin A)|nr:peptidase S10 [Terracidiphilus sp.]
MNSASRLVAVVFAAALLLLPLAARGDDKPPAAKPAATEKAAEAAPPADSTTEGTVDAGGQHIAYTAVAGMITVGATDAQDAQLDMDGKPLPGSQLAISAPKDEADAPPVARMFYVAYFKKGTRADDRPITFFYNGGPGSSTVWLHMGSLGPKYVATDSDEHLPAAPYKLEDNAETLLDVSDLVFIDAPGTGFGRLVGKDAEKAFWGVDEDGGAFTRFIARFISKYDRWNSPKFLFGESYGTTRSAVLAKMLEDKDSIDVNGVILLSQIFNFSVFIDVAEMNPGVDLPYELALPTYAATAWYHKKLSPEPPALEPLLKEVEAYAMGPYAHALAQGTDLGDAEKQAVAEKLHEYTALPVAYLLKANLRVEGGEFEKNFDDSQDLTTGRYDTRFTGPSIDPLSKEADYDPQSAAISSAYVSLLNDYMRRVLKYGEGQTYLAEIDASKWDFKHNENPLNLNVSSDLADAMKTNPRLKVMLNGGYYDLATPFFGAQYEEKHLPIPQSLAKNIQYDWYESGHMVYVRSECRKLLHDRVAAFIKGASSVQ